MQMFQEVFEAIQMLHEDTGLPRNTREKLSSIVQLLNTQEDVSLRVSKALSVLDDLQEDNNIQPFIRTQLYNVASLLECLEH